MKFTRPLVLCAAFVVAFIVFSFVKLLEVLTSVEPERDSNGNVTGFRKK